MTKGEEIVAALLFDRAARLQEGKFRGPISLLRDSSLEGYHCLEFSEAFNSAVDFWEKNGALRFHRHDGVEDYVYLDGTSTVAKVLFSLKANHLKSESPRIAKFPILESYFELGGSWLQDVAIAYRNEARKRNKEMGLDPIQSSSWTGRIIVSDAEKNRIIETLRLIDIKIDESNLSNVQKADAKALIEASQKLADAPNPPWESVLHILDSPMLANFISFVALIVAIVKP